MPEATDPPSTWRTILQRALRDPDERARLARELHISPVTLGRWLHSTSQPRASTLRRLPDVLPAYRVALQAALEEEFPTLFRTELFDADMLMTTVIQREPPLDFFLGICEASAYTPASIRNALLPEMVVQQTLKHLDPDHTGLLVEVALCLPSADGLSVRSLSVGLGRGTPPFRERIDQVIYLLGAESLMGTTVQTMHLQVNQHLIAPLSLGPGYAALGEQSAVAAPLLRAGRIAGCLCASSSQPNTFTPAHQDVLLRYAHILALILDEHHFVEPTHIHLAVMPPVHEQQKSFSQLWQRMTALVRERSVTEEPLSLLAAERLILQQIEADLLVQAWYHSSAPDADQSDRASDHADRSNAIDRHNVHYPQEGTPT